LAAGRCKRLSCRAIRIEESFGMVAGEAGAGMERYDEASHAFRNHAF